MNVQDYDISYYLHENNEGKVVFGAMSISITADNNKGAKFVEASLNNVSIKIPLEKFKNIIKNRGGSITYKNNRFSINRAKVRDITRVIEISDKVNVSRSEKMISTDEINQFFEFLNERKQIVALGYGKDHKGIDEWHLTVNHDIEYFDRDNKDRYKPDSYRLWVIDDNKSRMANLKTDINIILTHTNNVILLRNKEKMEDKLGIEFPKNRYVDFDEIYKVDDFIEASNGSIYNIYAKSNQICEDMSRMYYFKTFENNNTEIETIKNIIAKHAKINNELNVAKTGLVKDSEFDNLNKLPKIMDYYKNIKSINERSIVINGLFKLIERGDVKSVRTILFDIIEGNWDNSNSILAWTLHVGNHEILSMVVEYKEKYGYGENDLMDCMVCGLNNFIISAIKTKVKELERKSSENTIKLNTFLRNFN